EPPRKTGAGRQIVSARGVLSRGKYVPWARRPCHVNRNRARDLTYQSSMSLLDVQPLGRCVECSYALVPTLSERRCPECGKEFDPGNLETLTPGEPLSPTARWALGPLGRGPLLVVLAAAGFTLWRARLPQTGRSEFVQTLIWIFVAIVWLGWPLFR